MGKLIEDCPHCKANGDPRVELTDTGYVVRCRVCNAHTKGKLSGYEAIRGWNLRVRVGLPL